MRAICNSRSFCNFIQVAALLAISLTAMAVSPAAAQESGTRIPVRLDYCPPEQSLIPLLTRQAFEEGRKAESREHGKLTSELLRISTSSFYDEEIVDKSFAAIRTFIQSMQTRGHDIDFGDVVVHEETTLNSSLNYEPAPIRRAQLHLQLAIAQEMKRRICPH